jgi:DNA-binding CsgD family transcriptional regulator
MSKKPTSDHFFLSTSQAVDDICAPLKKHFGITSFVYFRSHIDGSEVRLSNQPEWLEFYYQNELYKKSELERHPDEYQSGFSLWSELNNHEIVLAPLKNFNIANGITLSIKVENGIELYFFGTTLENRSAVSLYLSNMDLLERFIVYFKDKAAPLIAEAEKHKLILPKSWSKPVDEDETAAIFKKNSIDRFAFEDETIIRHFHLDKTTTLSKRELEAAQLLLAGKTAKEAGEILFVSQRTIEAHWNNLKDKLHCRTKAELINKLLKLGLNPDGSYSLF